MSENKIDALKLCNAYQETLYDNVDKLIDNFGGLVDAAKVNFAKKKKSFSLNQLYLF